MPKLNAFDIFILNRTGKSKKENVILSIQQYIDRTQFLKKSLLRRKHCSTPDFQISESDP